MRLVRGAARLLTGTCFAVLGFDAARAPGGRVERSSATLAAMRKVAPLPEDDELLVRVNGAAQSAAGVALALGRCPRLSALVIAGSLVPTTFAGHAFWQVEDPAQRKAQRTQFLKNAAILGGLLMLATDRDQSRVRTALPGPLGRFGSGEG